MRVKRFEPLLVSRPRYRIAADIGGTFTDLALITDNGTAATWKMLSTPEEYSTAVIDGIRALMDSMDLPLSQVAEVVHGCTVATNAILERKGARTALVVTKGFRDLLELRRIRVPRLYDPLYVKPEPLVPRRHSLEVQERIGPRGEVLTPLDEEDVLRAAGHIRRHRIEAVAVSFLHSYANPAHEIAAVEILRRELPDLFITPSCEVLPEIREYERTSTTVINAYVGPPVRRYLGALSCRLREEGIRAPLMVMQSSGGMLASDSVLDQPAQIVECGPAAGVVGAAHLARTGEHRNLITLDMGGTTAKASIIEAGEVLKTDEYEVGGGISLSSRLVKGGGYALKTPVIDISEVGAGGGSIVWLDKAGNLKVGPQSAGASPGPACYGTGGMDPTVTDANVVLGYLNPTALAGGTVPVDAERARRAVVERVAGPLGRGPLVIAHGIHVLANASMMRAVKAVSTHRGRDPRDFALLAFGGSGGVHAVGLARALGIRRVIVPAAAGVFSALGLLLSDVGLIRKQAFLRRTDRIDAVEWDQTYAELESRIRASIGRAGETVAFRRFADLRYEGQAFELSVPVSGGTASPESLGVLAQAFEEEHERTYGHRFPGDKAVETVSLGVNGVACSDGHAKPGMRLFRERQSPDFPTRSMRSAYFGPHIGSIDTAVLSRSGLTPEPAEGPMVIEEYEGTIVVPPGATAWLDASGSVLIDSGDPGPVET